MAISREEFFRKLYYRYQGGGTDKKLYRCAHCGSGPLVATNDAVAEELCYVCEVNDWRELTEQEFVSEMIQEGTPILPSEYLASELEELYATDREPSEWAGVLGKFVECLEGFGDEETAAWWRSHREKYPKIMEKLLDEFYTRDFLKKARRMVDRTMKLAAMSPKQTRDHGVNLYLREATRCCIAGFWPSSVALSRTTLEVALRHRLNEGQGFLPTDDRFEKIIEAAHLCRVIDHAHRDMAEEVRRYGNEVVHGSPATENIAWRVLVCTRGVLAHIYSGS